MPDTTFGLYGAADMTLLGGTVQGMDVEKLSREKLLEMIDARTAARNKAINHIMAHLALPTRARGALIGQTADIGEWPKGTENDRGRRVRTGGLTGVGFPIYKFGPRRSGWTYEFLAKATNYQLLELFETIMAGHLEANYKDALRALVRNTSYDWNDDLFPEDGTLKVMPLVANGGDFIPPEFHGNEFDNTHNHYLNCGDTTLAQDDLVSAAAHIREHGYGLDGSVGGFGGYIIAWVNQAERDDVEGHAGFVPANDPVVYDVNKEYAVGLNPDLYFGYNKTARVYFRVVPWVPADYVVMYASTTLDPNAANGFAPLRRRIPTNEALVGIKRFSEKKLPLEESFWQDFFGYGVYNRISAVVLQKAAAYSVPTIS